jgi:hypothetical protein
MFRTAFTNSERCVVQSLVHLRNESIRYPIKLVTLQQQPYTTMSSSLGLLKSQV